MKKLRPGTALPAMVLVAFALAAAAYFALVPAGAIAPAAASTPAPAAASTPALAATSTPALAATPTSSASPSSTPSSTPTTSPSTTPSATPTATPSPTPTPPPPLKVVSVSPRAKARNVSFAHTIKITFSAPLAADTPLPKLTPRVPGVWKIVRGSTLEFVLKGHLPVYATVHLTIPAGSGGVRAADGGLLAKTRTQWFAVGGPSSVLRLQQLLAELGYLPLRFKVPVVRQVSGSTAKKTVYVSAIGHEPGSLDLISLTPRSGIFAWRYHHIPRRLAALWQRRRKTVLIRGAVMAFESDHKLAGDGVAGRKVWTALLRATARHLVSRRAYRYLEVSTSIPETLRVWQNGRIVYQSPTNTGIASRPTALGTYPVYARFLSTTMSGTNPDGSHYNDPGVPYVAYFNGGDAVHGFLRASYGYPQSLGCVELPYAAAAVVFSYDPIGTLVAIS